MGASQMLDQALDARRRPSQICNRHGTAMPGVARRGWAGQGEAWQAEAGLGSARLGKTKQSTAWTKTSFGPKDRRGFFRARFKEV
jgi:hypothetical protein